jgi:hypothetical protein
MLRSPLLPALLLAACTADADKSSDTDLPVDTDDTVIPDTEPLEPTVLVCPSAIDDAVLVCLADLQADPEQGGALIDLLLACADPEPVATAYDAYCAAQPLDPICALAYATFTDLVLPECVARVQDAVFNEVCLFPPRFEDVLVSPGLALLERRTVRAAGELSEIEAEQLVLASGEADLDAALALAGAEGWRLLRLLEVGFDRELVFFTADGDGGALGAGFFAGTRFQVATVAAGELSGCAVEIGLEGRVCSDASECEGRMCVGIVRTEDQLTVLADGVCSQSPIEGEGDLCTGDSDCGAGMICALFGTGAEEGACSAGWMRRSYRADLSQASLVADGTLRLPFNVSGLATVPTVLTLDLIVDLETPGELELTLLNPFETPSVIGARSGDRVELFAASVWAPGDESVNGRWVLELADVGGGASGRVLEALITIDSRWD